MIRTAQPTLFDASRLSLGESIEITVQSLRAYGSRHDHWAIAWSGGKDSTTLLTVVLHLVKRGLVDPPRRLTVCYADTRMELPPLAEAARQMLERLASEGVSTRVVMAPLDLRFFVYMLGRGVPPPNNNTFRWCTRQIKVDPMHAELRRLVGEANGQKILMLTGVRIGESAQRDARISLSCGKNGAECGQGWYQETLASETCDTLAPILHWRTCLVWDWLAGHLDRQWRHGYPTQLVAEAYGLGVEGSEAELNARTGCCGCPLATRDTAIDNLLRSERWGYLEPLTELRPLYRWLREPAQRLRKPGGETRQDGTLSRNQHRMGPLTMKARNAALATVLGIQARCNSMRGSMPAVDILNEGEVARIRELIEAGTWPQKWSGDEPTADEPFEEGTVGGEIQRLLPILSEGAS